MMYDKFIDQARRTIADCYNDGYSDGIRYGEEKTVNAVLEIIDSEVWSYCDYIIKHENGNRDKQGAASHLADNIREAVSALKGGEQE